MKFSVVFEKTLLNIEKFLKNIKKAFNPQPNLDKQDLIKRLAEIATGVCPSCKSAIVYSRKANYISCENQYDPTNSLNLKGKGNCTRMITSVELIEFYCRKYNVDPSVLHDYTI